VLPPGFFGRTWSFGLALGSEGNRLPARGRVVAAGTMALAQAADDPAGFESPSFTRSSASRCCPSMSLDGIGARGYTRFGGCSCAIRMFLPRSFVIRSRLIAGALILLGKLVLRNMDEPFRLCGN